MKIHTQTEVDACFSIDMSDDRTIRQIRRIDESGEQMIDPDN